MIRATKVLPRQQWTAVAADTVVLDFDERHRRRTLMTGVGGLDFLLDLAETVVLRGGDALRLDDGRLVEVVAAPEPLVEIRGNAPGDLVRLAWHIGNRHLPAQVMPKAIRIRQDHVVEEMLRGLGAKLVAIEAPFDPEGGAYAKADDEHGGHDHGHAGHDHLGHAHRHRDHDHAQDRHGHAHGHEPHKHEG